jgi:hypothetical protein
MGVDGQRKCGLITGSPVKSSRAEWELELGREQTSLGGMRWTS